MNEGGFLGRAQNFQMFEYTKLPYHESIGFWKHEISFCFLIYEFLYQSFA